MEMCGACNRKYEYFQNHLKAKFICHVLEYKFSSHRDFENSWCIDCSDALQVFILRTNGYLICCETVEEAVYVIRNLVTACDHQVQKIFCQRVKGDELPCQ